MILFVGQVERSARQREAFQELDYRAVFGKLAKGVTEIDDLRRLPELVSSAFHVAAGLKNPDFAAYAQAFGAHGERVSDTASFAPALQRALARGEPALLHCLIDPQAITPTSTLDGLRQQALRA